MLQAASPFALPSDAGNASCGSGELRPEKTLDCNNSDMHNHVMKNMSITIDEDTLRLLDSLIRTASPARSRSAVVRTAIRELVERESRHQVENRERQILRKHRKELARQAQALIEEQARL